GPIGLLSRSKTATTSVASSSRNSKKKSKLGSRSRRRSDTRATGRAAVARPEQRAAHISTAEFPPGTRDNASARRPGWLRPGDGSVRKPSSCNAHRDRTLRSRGDDNRRGSDRDGRSLRAPREAGGRPPLPERPGRLLNLDPKHSQLEFGETYVSPLYW